MKKQPRYAVLFLALTALACADDVSTHDGLDEQPGVTVAQGTQALAEIELSPTEKISFYASESGIAVAEIYPLGSQPLLSEQDRKLDAVELYRRFAPSDEVPQALLEAANRVVFLEEGEELSETTVEHSTAGGGRALELDDTRGAHDALGHVSQALTPGQGCNPPYASTVFADCRRHWWGGYYAYAVPTFRLDWRVEALQGPLTVRLTSTFGGKTQYYSVKLSQGQVSSLYFPPGRLCSSFLGLEVDCWNEKVTRRVDILDALNSEFNVDVVFYN